MPSEERKSARNGIWLCSNCHDQVDRNVKTYTVEELKRLKHEGEKSAREQLGKPPPTTKQVRSSLLYIPQVLTVLLL
jgi:Zn-finger protein